MRENAISEEEPISIGTRGEVDAAAVLELLEDVFIVMEDVPRPRRGWTEGEREGTKHREEKLEVKVTGTKVAGNCTKSSGEGAMVMLGKGRESRKMRRWIAKERRYKCWEQNLICTNKCNADLTRWVKAMEIERGRIIFSAQTSTQIDWGWP